MCNELLNIVHFFSLSSTTVEIFLRYSCVQSVVIILTQPTGLDILRSSNPVVLFVFVIDMGTTLSFFSPVIKLQICYIQLPFHCIFILETSIYH